MKKLMFYSHDSYGLGNIRRMVSIATYLVNKHRDLFILMLTGSPMYHAFRTHPQIDYVKLPCLSRNIEGQYQPRLKCFGTNQLKALRSQLILNTFKNFNPDLCVIDKKPTGLSGELSPIFEPTTQASQCKHLLLLRDILDSPEKTKQVWHNHHYHKTIEDHYQEVLVVGDSSVFDLPKEYDFPSSVINKTTFCGYLAKPLKMPVTIGKQSSDKSYKIVVAVGGGNDGHQLIETYLQSVMLEEFPSNIRHHIVLGPEMGEEMTKPLIAHAHQLANITIEHFNADFISLIQSADLVISMAGYNTVCELLSCNTPAILLPRTTPVKEQLIRAQRLHQRGAFDYLNEEQVSPIALAHKIRHQLDNQVKPQQNIQLNNKGMQVIEDKILSYLH